MHHFSLHEDPMAPAMEHYYMSQHARYVDITPDGPMWPQVTASSSSELDALGTSAIARMLPTNPAVNFATLMGEMFSDGLPSVKPQTWADETNRARGAGKDYLNQQFGWMPLVSDIRAFHKTAQNANSILDRFVSEAGKVIHRKYEFPTEETYDRQNYYGTHMPQPMPDWDIHWLRARAPKFTEININSTRRWVEAAFIYYVPPVGTWDRDFALSNKLYGTDITPEVMWELTPWSWAADWLTNMQDVMHNVSAFGQNGLVMPYAYIMEHKLSKVIWQISDVRYKSYPGSQTFRQTFTTEVKSRRKATPFGFGLDVSSFTGRQWAILAALGISRT